MVEAVVGGLPGRVVGVVGIGLICPAGIGVEGASGGRPGEVPGFRARAYVPDRKSLKLMTRAVQLGMSAVRLALAEGPVEDDWQAFPPERRGMFVGASPQAGDPDDLRAALDAAWVDGDRFDLGRFATDGIPLIHPLWLVRGLSNNVLGFASANFDIQGVNMNYCDGEQGGWNALVEGALAVAEGRADVVLAGGADALVAAEPLLGGRRCGEGAAFVLFRALSERPAGCPVIPLERAILSADEEDLGYLGAATWPVAYTRHLHRLVHLSVQASDNR